MNQFLFSRLERARFKTVAIWRIVNGKIAEAWEVQDMSELLLQLGVIDYKGFPDEKFLS